MHNNRRIVNTIASIWHENMLEYLSLDIICPSELSFPLASLLENSEQILSRDKYPASIFLHQIEAIV